MNVTIQQPKPHLILDVGGVLLTNLTPSFWTQVARMSGVDYAALRRSYKEEVRDDLWSGALEEPAFMSWLSARCPGVSEQAARAILLDCLLPLPALERLADWAHIAHLHILSNHRDEWLAPKLAEYAASFQSMTVSSKAGSFKPNTAIYRLAAEAANGNSPILFVDDSVNNLRQAEAIGWNTLLADAEGQWIGQVESLLRELTNEAAKRSN